MRKTLLEATTFSLYPHAERTPPTVGDYVKLLFQFPTGQTAGIWYRVTGQCRDGRYRGRGASSMVSPSDEVRFLPRHVVERRRPTKWYDRALAWVLQRNATPC